MQDIEGKVAFVTGGASGLGFAMAQSFLAAGMKVAIADIEDAALAAASEQLGSNDAELIALQVDVTDRQAMSAAKEATLSAFGKVHVVCNNAGVAVGGHVADMSYADWDWVMGVNLQGVINGIVTFLPHIRAQGEAGHFVNTASIAGHLGMPSLSVYNATKFAVVGITESMRLDLASENIGASVLCPGVVGTNLFDSERNRPEALAGSQDNRLVGRGLADEERQAALEERATDMMPPAVIGDMVLHAVRQNELYILSHEEFRAPLEARAEEIAKSFDRWAQYRNQRGV
ncbi:MAG: SDR family NAD(P)-dependent oxidoreductase [Pseudomonadales bacterium]